MGARASAVLRSETLEDFSGGKLDARNVSKAETRSFAPLKVCRRRAHSPTRRFAPQRFASGRSIQRKAKAAMERIIPTEQTPAQPAIAQAWAPIKEPMEPPKK